jgi:hypothetical protein
MVTTHVMVGVTAVATLVYVAPELAVVGALGAIGGGFFPDVDLFVGTHRRTLHYPALYWVAAIPALGLAVFVPNPATVAAVSFLTSAGLHSISDVLGAGEELRPWERTVDEAVYLHPAGRWLRARRIIRYDGAPEDLLLTTVFALPGVLLYTGSVRYICLFCVLLATAYTLVRKRVPEYVGRFVE